MFTEEVIRSIEKSVLCWLASADADGFPNVSPKEMFTYEGDDLLLIANIASPNSVNNILQNNKVCVSFVDILLQKGFKLKGLARVIPKENVDFKYKAALLTGLFSDVFPIQSIIEVTVTKTERILAPRYFLFPETTEAEQIESAKRTYGFTAEES